MYRKKDKEKQFAHLCGLENRLYGMKSAKNQDKNKNRDIEMLGAKEGLP